jgi:hypothetical protein
MYFYGSSVSGVGASYAGVEHDIHGLLTICTFMVRRYLVLVLRMLVSNMIFMVWKNVGKYSERYGGLLRRILNSNVMQESDSALLKTLGSCILVGSTASDRFRCIR